MQESEECLGSMLDIGGLREVLTARKVQAVAIDGRGGSGKSVLARGLAKGWPKAVVIEIDDFYRVSAERVERPEAHGANYDRERLVAEVLDPVASGRAGRYRRYDWDHDALAEWHDVPADAVLLVEGVYSTSEPLRRYFDYAIWVDCPYEVRLRRAIERDGEAMRAQWVERWMPAEDRYVAEDPPDARVNLLLDGSGTGADRIAFEVKRLPGRTFLDIPTAKHDLHLDRPTEWRAAHTAVPSTMTPAPGGPHRPLELTFPAGLEDNAIRLEPWSDTDLSALRKASTDNSITRITAVPARYSREAALAFVRDRHEAARQGLALSMAIHDKGTKATVGAVNLNSFDWERRSGRAGYWVLASGRGRGAATGALRLISDWALGDLGLRHLEMHIEADNEASMKVAAGAGYREAGTVRDKPFGKDLELDMLRYVRDAGLSDRI